MCGNRASGRINGGYMLQEHSRQHSAAVALKQRFANLKPREVIPIQNLDVSVTIAPTVIPQKWNWGDCSFRRYEYPPLKDIMAACAGYYHVEVEDIKSHRRYALIVRARQMYFYLARNMTPRSLPDIGRFCAGKDHTTVMHGARKIAALVNAGDPVLDTIDVLRGRLARRLDRLNGNRMEAVEILGA